MNLLSLYSTILATAFIIGAVYNVTRSRKFVLNLFAFLVLLSLGWWNLCSAFFFSAETAAEAMRWHHWGALGWVGFIGSTTYYFFVLTGRNVRMRKAWKQVAFYALPTVLMVRNLFGDTTSLATGIVRSEIGGQWTFVNDLSNPWLWAYLVCVAVYFGVSFYLLLSWQGGIKHQLKRRMAVGFVALDTLTILLGVVTDVILPLSTPLLPSMANLCTALFGIGYFLLIIRYDLFNIHLVVPDREVLERGTESVFVTDETGEILYCNPAAAALLETERHALVGKELGDCLDLTAQTARLRSELESGDVAEGIELAQHTAAGDRVLLLSAAIIRDRFNVYLGTVFTLRDITALMLLKEQYKIQSDEYERLAFVDTLTGLPNRRRTFDVLNARARQYVLTGEDFFILYLDLDDFKSVNDRFGHDIGDLFLQAIAQRLSGCLGKPLDMLGRLGGDELMMVGSGGTEAEIAESIDRVNAAFQEAFIVGGKRVESSVSIGSARYSEFQDIDGMMHHADSTMYRAKNSGSSKLRKRSRATGQEL